jgi:predicted DNA-binding transcriptional regulator YafY
MHSSTPPPPLIDITTESLISLSEAARFFPASRGAGRISTSTLWRFIAVGIPGPDGGRIRLAAVRLSSRWLTSREALARFLAAQTPTFGDSTPRGAPRTPAKRLRMSQQAGKECGQRGA